MGGAFIGVADDVNAVYWNPAGLVQIEDIQLTYTPTLYDRDTINYDDFVSAVSPLRFSGQDWGSLGISFINSGYKETGGQIIDRWTWLSYAKKLPLNLSLGVNLRHQNYKWRVNRGYYIVGTSIIGPVEDSDSALGVDVAFFWKWQKFSLGVLWQDLNEPEYSLFGDRIRLQSINNLRPGMAYRPDHKTTLSAELYDVTSQSATENYDLRMGIERWFDLPLKGSELAVRAGGYNINASEKSSRAVTGGLGWKLGPGVLSECDEWPMTLDIDYTVMYWTDTPSGGDFTHLLGFKVSVPWEIRDKNQALAPGKFSQTKCVQKRTRALLRNAIFEDLSCKKPNKIKDAFLQKPQNRAFRNSATSRIEAGDIRQEKLKEELAPQIFAQKEKNSVPDEKTNYYRDVYEKLKEQFFKRPTSLTGTAQLVFSVNAGGKIENVKVYSYDYGLKEVVEEMLNDMPCLPCVPHELEGREMKFELNVIFG